ncbi:MFS general substrate transporter [Westerdykella ornata]|uniref:MFS general substrate transporter n=1 Tax=Westerdykella ornata TaxID=318751 RepID=A0A6A6JXJ6_WESOR|nr:MFS general substrate transporter [Westerdykella ornata]KAF2280456.1 MFS general substrate transporter [Westerdykella ornata]
MEPQRESFELSPRRLREYTTSGQNTDREIPAVHPSVREADALSEIRSSIISEDTRPQEEVDVDIDNPLRVLSESERNRKINELIEFDRGLRDYRNLLRRGGIHATVQVPRIVVEDDQDGQNLSRAQKRYLKRETKLGTFRQSKHLRSSLLATCLAGMIQGWTQSAINGSNLAMAQEFHIQVSSRPIATPGLPEPGKSEHSLWMFGFVTAVPFLIGGIVAPIISDPLQERHLGRRGAIAVACLVSIGATIGQAFSKTLDHLIGCRLLIGASLAAKASAAPLLTAEVAPNHLRGNLLATWQLSDAFGIFLGFSANLAILNIHSANSNIIWRLQTVTVLIPTVLLLFVVLLTPESPRFLMKHGKLRRALESFILLRPTPVSAIAGARDFVYAHFQLDAESKSMGRHLAAREMDDSESIGSEYPDDDSIAGVPPRRHLPPPRYHHSQTSYFRRLAYFWRVPRARRSLACASTAMVAQQFTGVNTIVFLSTVLLAKAGASAVDSAWVGFGLGLTNFIFGIPAFYYGETIGRATLLLLGFPFMFLFMLLLAIFFGIREPGEHSLTVLFGIFGLLFMISYSPTAGTSPFAISAEVFPLVIREVGHSLAVTVNFVLLGVVLLVFPSLSDNKGAYGSSLGLFAGLNVIAFVLCYLYVPETKGRTLEELRSTFDLPTRIHIRYRMLYITEWFAMRFLLPVALKLHLLKSKRRKDLRERSEMFKQRITFHRWGPEEIQVARRRWQAATQCETIPDVEHLFYPWGQARRPPPGRVETNGDIDGQNR